MGNPSRTDRAAGAIVALEGLALLGLVGDTLVRNMPNLGSADPHLAGDATMNLLYGGLPIAFAGLLILFLGVRLWRGRPGAKTLAAGLVAVGGVFSVAMLSGFGNVLWALGVIVTDPGALTFEWPYWILDPFRDKGVYGTPVEQFPRGRLDEIYFWYPGLIALAALLVAGLLVAGWFARRPRSAPPT